MSAQARLQESGIAHHHASSLNRPHVTRSDVWHGHTTKRRARECDERDGACLALLFRRATIGACAHHARQETRGVLAADGRHYFQSMRHVVSRRSTSSSEGNVSRGVFSVLAKCADTWAGARAAASTSREARRLGSWAGRVLERAVLPWPSIAWSSELKADLRRASGRSCSIAD